MQVALLNILFFYGALTWFSGAQTSLPSPAVEVVAFSWRKLQPSAIPSGKKSQEMRNAQLDRRIQEESANEHPNLNNINQLERLKQNSMTPLDAPGAADKPYEYTFVLKNTGDREIVSLKFRYIFSDSITKQELLRHVFGGAIKIKPGKKKKIVVLTDASPPKIVDAKTAASTSKAWQEQLIIQSVVYSDGSKYEAQ